MKQRVEDALNEAIAAYFGRRGSGSMPEYRAEVERAKDAAHGDFASNAAMALAKPAGMKPRDLAQGIIEHLPPGELIEKVEVAGPGFINFFLAPSAYREIIPEILQSAENYGRLAYGEGKKLLVEFVSANPTGPLHIGHGRGAAYGAALSSLLDAAGFDVTREYYVNDAGRQMDILTLSVWLRYLGLCGLGFPYPENAYQGEYIRQIAEILHQKRGAELAILPHEVGELSSNDFDQERELDRLIDFAKARLEEKNYSEIFNLVMTQILDEIRSDLEAFGVHMDNWFSERSLLQNGYVGQCVEKLESGDFLYEKDNAKWFRSTRFGDEKDRVVIRENGQPTYFASDIAYHMNKFERSFDAAINIWGADHHGYINRVKGSLQALGLDPGRLHILLVQFAVLYRGKTKVSMSTRSGEYVPLKQLIDEIGKDAARYFYVTRKSEQHLDFDLELAKSKSNENPVYYIQYAHARICSVLKQMRERDYNYDRETAFANLSLLKENHELKLMKTLSRYPEVILAAAGNYEPHLVAFYLRDIATDFHAYYNSHQLLVKDVELRQSRISLILATRQVLQNGLSILGVSAPEEM